MTRALALEDFGASQTVADTPVANPMGPPVPPPADPAEALPAEGDPTGLEAFEQGYRSGWDDCIAHETEERRRIGADLAVALSEITLSAEAIRRDLMAGLSPLLEEIALQLLPQLAAEAVLPVLLEEIRTILRTEGPVTLEILAAPAKCRPIEALIRSATVLPVTVVPEPAYAEGQVSIRFAGQRRDIDLADTAARMAGLIRDFAAVSTAPGGQTGRDEIEPQRGAA